jgi:HSP20 family protein
VKAKDDDLNVQPEMKRRCVMTRLVRNNPRSLINELNNLFEGSLDPLSQDTSSALTGQWIPSVDIKEDKNQFTIEADLPGMEKKDVNVSMENNVLTVQGERKEEKEANEQSNYYRYERVKGSFHRSFTLPETADSENIQASLKDGILTISVPKKEKAQPKAIEIK